MKRRDWSISTAPFPKHVTTSTNKRPLLSSHKNRAKSTGSIHFLMLGEKTRKMESSIESPKPLIKAANFGFKPPNTVLRHTKVLTALPPARVCEYHQSHRKKPSTTKYRQEPSVFAFCHVFIIEVFVCWFGGCFACFERSLSCSSHPPPQT